MATPTQVIEDFIGAFVLAWPSGDPARVAAYFDDDASYQNGPLPEVRGRAAIEATLAEFMAMGGEVTVEMLNLLADERAVMTERVDHFAVSGRTFSLRVMGTFEVVNEKIVAWRDYFDLEQFRSLFDSAG
jgi:limonene-1,2-epoxide hydrolase